MSYLDSLDIANQACKILGVRKIASITEDSRQNNLLADAYDMFLDVELQRNIWTFACKRAALRVITATTMEIVPQQWNTQQLYLPGSIVADDNGDLWVSSTPENLGNDPLTSGVWDQYFGPMTADVWDSTQSYFAGELVYKAGTHPGSFIVFMALVNGASEEPDTTDAWSSTTQYQINDVVSYSGSQWRSLIPFNIGTTPAAGPFAYQAATVYALNATVEASDGYIYTSLANGNTGNDPTTDGGVHWTNSGVPVAWSNSPAIYPSSTQWAPVFADLTAIRLLEPLTGGPLPTSQPRSMYRLPANYLFRAPQNPKQGAIAVLGGPTGYTYNDWEYNGDYIITSQTTVILFRFIASIRKVTEMSALFCSALAARMAMETSEPLTQSDGKFQKAGTEYKLAVNDARTKNAIEQGFEEPPEDEYIQVRW